MSEAHFAGIQQIIDAIRLDEVRPGTKIRTSTTLATCPADMDQIERNLRALEEEEQRVRADERRKVIEELADAGSDCYLYVSGEAHQPWLPDWLRAQQDEPDDRKIYIGFRQKERERKAIFSEGIEIETFDRVNGPYRVTDIATGAPIAGVIDWQLVEGSDVVLDHIGETDLAIKHHQLVQLTIDSMGVVCTITMPAEVKRP